MLKQPVMLNKLVIAASLLLAACLDTPPPVTYRGIDSDVRIEPDTSGSSDAADTDWDGRKPTKTSGIARVFEDGPSICERLVATDGACAVACDVDKLLAFIPEGTCALFLCDLDDGTQYRTGGCNR